MRRIIYYVAASIDGFISGPDENIRGFENVQESEGIQKYLQDLQNFDTVIMGKKTYEFGYKFGLKPGEPVYLHMNHYIFSRSLKLDSPDKRIEVCKPDLEIVRKLKGQEGADIYLCGGGHFAGWLLDNELIDELKIKLNPLILGSGIRLFGASRKQFKMRLIDSKTFTYGLQIINYQIEY